MDNKKLVILRRPLQSRKGLTNWPHSYVVILGCWTKKGVGPSTTLREEWWAINKFTCIFIN